MACRIIVATRVEDNTIRLVRFALAFSDDALLTGVRLTQEQK